MAGRKPGVYLTDVVAPSVSPPDTGATLGLWVRVTRSHVVRRRGLTWLWAKLRRRPTSYTVIDAMEPLGTEWVR